MIGTDAKKFSDPDFAMPLWSPDKIILAPRPSDPYQRAVVTPSRSWVTVNRRVE
jgi:hypothetical protein